MLWQKWINRRSFNAKQCEVILFMLRDFFCSYNFNHGPSLLCLHFARALRERPLASVCPCLTPFLTLLFLKNSLTNKCKGRVVVRIISNFKLKILWNLHQYCSYLPMTKINFFYKVIKSHKHIAERLLEVGQLKIEFNQKMFWGICVVMCGDIISQKKQWVFFQNKAE
jgi:hypothetical protein